MRRPILLLLTLIAFALRLWRLDAKGLAYDEAATALMARATPVEIMVFHWRAAFEHPPLWQLLMHYWSIEVGQSEFALRLPSVMAGVLTLPLLWQLAHRLGLSARTACIATLLTTIAPVLLYYSQEARMYAIVVALAVGSLLITHQLALAPQPSRIILFWVINWAMLGLHYYSALLIVAEGIFLLVWLLLQRRPLAHWVAYALALLVTALPLALWMLFSPGFQDTATAVLGGAAMLNGGDDQPSAFQFLDGFWRDVTFAAIRWQHPNAGWGYLWLPLVGLGLIALFGPALSNRLKISSWPSPCKGLHSAQNEDPYRVTNREVSFGHSLNKGRQASLLLVLAWLVPIGITLLLSRTLATRYLLYVVPPLLLVIATAITWLGQIHWSVGAIALVVVLTPTSLALPHYFGPYQKSAYREMIAYLNTHRRSEEALLLEGPRQHLLTKYYLPTEKTLLTAPMLELPTYWPVNASPVVPEVMDDYLLQSLREYKGIWLSLTAENEVDAGEFVPKFLTAVAFQRDCHGWLDVRLCHFVSPHFVQPQVQTTLDAHFNDELQLQTASIGLMAARVDEPAYLLTTLTWLAQVKPTVDYRVTLRLVDATGQTVSQRDEFPIGPLLPPSTWNAGDVKPGYLALPIVESIPPGRYQLLVKLYDPTTLAPIPHHTPEQSATEAALILANVSIGDTIEVTKSGR